MSYPIKKPSDRFTIRSKVRAIIIDKKTGRIKAVVESKNAVTDLGALYLLTAIDRGFASATNPWAYLYIYDTYGSHIKTVGPGSWGTRTDTGTAMENTVVVEDTSADEYTCQYFGLHEASGTAVYGKTRLAGKWPSAVTKGAGDILRVEWTVSVAYEAPP